VFPNLLSIPRNTLAAGGSARLVSFTSVAYSEGVEGCFFGHKTEHLKLAFQ